MASLRKRILIVDDDVEFVESNKDLLEANGYEVLSAHDGTSGLELAKKEKPDLMILDVMMATNTEGFEVSRKIPESPELKNMPDHARHRHPPGNAPARSRSSPTTPGCRWTRSSRSRSSPQTLLDEIKKRIG